MRDLPKIIGAYRKSLIGEGIPDDEATDLTRDCQTDLIEGIMAEAKERDEGDD